MSIVRLGLVVIVSSPFPLRLRSDRVVEGLPSASLSGRARIFGWRVRWNIDASRDLVE